MGDQEILKTPEEYEKALEAMRPNIVRDKLLEKPYDDPDIQKGRNVVALTYKRAHDEETKDIMTVKSPLTGKVINRYNHIPETREDLTKKIQMINTLAKEVGCVQRCVGSDGLHALHIGTHQLDKANKGETNYHQRLLDYLRYIQDNDIAPAGAITDAKGDRSLLPHMQAEKDTYVHIVKENDEGIWVSGIKTPITTSLYAEEIIVLPGLQFGETDKDCAVAFAVPGDAEGLERYVLGPEITALDYDYAPSYGKNYLNKEGLIYFNNCFIPHERVFLKGEHKYAAIYANLFATLHRFAYTACKPAIFDLLTGSAMLVSEYNGTKGDYFLSNTNEKIFEIYKASILVSGMSKAAIVAAKDTEDGSILPDAVYANMGKFIASEMLLDAIGVLQDMAGSLPANLPYQELLDDEEYGPKISKLFARKAGISAKEQYSLNELVRIAAGSAISGLLQIGSKHGGGNKEAEKVAIYGNSLRRMNQCKKQAKRMMATDVD
ncbi:4-hydroxyphenylacetate 3-hydroxylase N-terminal domain-containing protein [Gemmatimonadota bacterium]